MATVMGVQPILTAVILERRHSFSRSLGLMLGLRTGLILVVYQNIGLAGLSWGGMLCALLALGSMTAGTLMQKRITQNPLGTLPLQYLAGLLAFVLAPFPQPFHFEHGAGFVLPVLRMGLVSVLATLLLYRMIAWGNLVNVTSLFYLVPAVTAVMDYLIFGNKLALLSVLGMALIIIGLVFVFRKTTR